MPTSTILSCVSSLRVSLRNLLLILTLRHMKLERNFDRTSTVNGLVHTQVSYAVKIGYTVYSAPSTTYLHASLVIAAINSSRNSVASVSSLVIAANQTLRKSVLKSDYRPNATA